MTNKEIYRTLCEEEPSIPIYSKAFWMDAVCGEENWDVLLYEKGGNVLGALPYYTKEKMGMKYITQPPFTQHNGVWIKFPEKIQYNKRISLEKEIITDFIKNLEKLPVTFYYQNHSPMLTNWLPFYWMGYKQTTRYTYRIKNISDVNKVFQAFQPNKRKNINKANRANISVNFDLAPNIFYTHHKESLNKRGTKISYSFELFERIYRAAYSNHAGRIIYATDENGKLLCALFNVWDKNMGYDLISTIDPDSRNTGASDLLVYSMLQYLSDKVEGYDFEGSMLEGVEESFRHFGAVQVPYFAIKKIYSKNPLIQYYIEKKMS